MVRICEGADHPALFARTLATEPAATSWISGAPPEHLAELGDGGGELHCHIRVRHPGELHACRVDRSRALPGGALRVTFDAPVRGLAEMQAVAFYDGDECLGGSTIWERGPNVLEEARALHRVGYSGDGAASYVRG